MSAQEYYGVTLDIVATGSMTFRRMPSAILHISSYPFIPPTTLSGWLRRLWLLHEGLLPETTVKNPDFYAMPRAYHVLGAYPQVGDISARNGTKVTENAVHVAKRHGVRSFNHDAFSRLSGSRSTHEVYQLHTWEYLTATRFRGLVLHEDEAALNTLSELVNFGCKCGKEGYAYLEATSEVTTYERRHCAAVSSVPGTGDELLGQPADMFVAYRYEHDPQKPDPSPTEHGPSPIRGYAALWLGWPSEHIAIDYVTNGTHFVPVGMLEVF